MPRITSATRSPPPRRRRLANPIVLSVLVSLAVIALYVFSPQIRPAMRTLRQGFVGWTLGVDEGGSGADDGEVLRTRLVAVGDLHGDIGNARQVLHMAGVVDAAGKWTGDVDVFVQTGDIIDR